MNRNDFMDQLESLLQNISSTEREEALQYYEGYFDDAGKENEQEVIEALGNPARVAENIKRDLLGNGGVDGAARKVRACDRVLVEYGKESQEEEISDGAPDGGEESGGQKTAESRSGAGNDQEGGPGTGFGQGTQAASGSSQGGGPGTGFGQGTQTASGSSPDSQAGAGFGEAADMFSSQDWMGGDPYSWQTGGAEGYGGAGQYDDFGWHSGSGLTGGSGQPGKPGSGLPGWAVALLVVALLPACPLVLGIFGTLLGLVVSWFAMIFGFGVAAAALLVVFVILAVVGIICMFANPWVGAALVGGGLLCGALGLVFLMATVAMAGIATPAVIRGIKFLFGKRAKGRI